MKKIKINLSLRFKLTHYKIGEKLEVDEETAYCLINRGIAEAVGWKPKKAKLEAGVLNCESKISV